MGDPQFYLFLESPKVPFERKSSLLSERLEGLTPLAMNLARLLVARGRVRIAEDIASEYERLLDSYNGIEHAEVTTAIPIDDDQKAELARRLAEIVGRQVVLTTRIDPQITGGLVARIGDRLIDGSTKGRLAQLRRDLIEMAR